MKPLALMRRGWPIPLIFILLAPPLSARHVASACGATRETPNETLFLHRQAVRARSQARPLAPAVPPPSANRDSGDIAIIEDTGGVVARVNQFNLDGNTLTFAPTALDAGRYRYTVTPQGYDAAAASAGSPLVALGDDDTRQVDLPFTFPFFGNTYTQVFVNSDGNLTFTASDFASTSRSLGRMTAGPPRIAPLFDDLDPSRTAGGVRVLAGATRVVLSWVGVPEYSDFGAGVPETFQARLYPDGRIEFSYAGINPAIASAIVGIAPGNLQGATTLVDFLGDPSGDYSAAVAERFGNALAIDIVTVAQQFYQTHEDSYDYLVIYNNMDIPALGDAVAYENTVRNSGTGYAVPVFDTGQQYGSVSRLRSVLNMGQLSEYPTDPNGIVPLRAQAGDTPLTLLTHETGHLFLAFASTRDPSDPAARPMLGYQLAHWNFAYDSEASVLEGERIVDQGAGTSPRFLTTDTVQGYSPLDQYLMGFRPPTGVADTFLVTNVTIGGFPTAVSQWHPARGIAFDGTRQNIGANDIVQAEGRRTPDDTVAQRRFRFAFILVVPQGSQPSAADLSQVDPYRQQFEAFYAKASSGNGIADTTLRRSMKLSLFPAAGVVVGASGAATLTLQSPAPAAGLVVRFQAPGGNAQLPASVLIPAGATSVSFSFTGLKSGVEEVLATPSDPSFETIAARVQVADASTVKLAAVSGAEQVPDSSGFLPGPIVLRLTDENGLPYPGARIDATPSAGGSAVPAFAITDAQGEASFRWKPGAAPANHLQFALDSLPAVGLTISSGTAVPVAMRVTNSASFADGIVPGAIESIFGAHFTGGAAAQSSYPWPTQLAGAQVLLNGSPLPLLYVSDTQINFYVPQSTPVGPGTLASVTPSGAQAAIPVSVQAVLPGIFEGAVLHAGTGVSAVNTPVRAGDYIEIYCTGLGVTQPSGGLDRTVFTPTVFVGDVPVPPVYSGLAPGYVGLYQVDVQVPVGLAPGAQPVILEVSQQSSNSVKITVQ